jgi:hypothetical protein
LSVRPLARQVRQGRSQDQHFGLQFLWLEKWGDLMVLGLWMGWLVCHGGGPFSKENAPERTQTSPTVAGGTSFRCAHIGGPFDRSPDALASGADRGGPARRHSAPSLPPLALCGGQTTVAASSAGAKLNRSGGRAPTSWPSARASRPAHFMRRSDAQLPGEAAQHPVTGG